MNQLHPEWGPARHDPEDPCSQQSLQACLDQRYVDGPRPDDN